MFDPLPQSSSRSERRAARRASSRATFAAIPLWKPITASVLTLLLVITTLVASTGVVTFPDVSPTPTPTPSAVPSGAATEPAQWDPAREELLLRLEVTAIGLYLEKGIKAKDPAITTELTTVPRKLGKESAPALQHLMKVKVSKDAKGKLQACVAGKTLAGKTWYYLTAKKESFANVGAKDNCPKP